MEQVEHHSGSTSACSKQPEDRCRPLQNGDIFEELPGEFLNHEIRDRLNDYGLVAGIVFTTMNLRICRNTRRWTAELSPL